MIRLVVYLLRIFKMFYGLMNNPVYLLTWRVEITYITYCVKTYST